MRRPSGQILLQALIFGAVAMAFSGAVGGWSLVNITATRHSINVQDVRRIAEAGVDYYRWHLAHAPSDFKDGTNTNGPYVHSFKDANGTTVGSFALTITPPPLGSSLVTVASKGTVLADPKVTRTITVRLAKPSFAKYAVAANDVMRFGEGTEAFGPIHSNQGIRFDGLAHNVISSAVAAYDDPDHSGANEFGVHTHVNPVDPLPPTAVPVRSDVFEAGRQFPVPAIDFAGITGDMAQMKADAQSGGFYRSTSGSLGYHVVLKTNDTFDLYRVTRLTTPPSGCTNTQNQTGWSTWSIRTQTLIGNYADPVNGILFLEDDVWVDGTISTARVTVVAALLPDNPSTRKSITVNNDLKYTNYDGTDVIGLIAQGNINVGLVSEDDLRIDGALIAQNGRVGRYYYPGPGGGSQRCSPNYIRQVITLWGMIATYQRYGFAYTDGTGYQTRNLNYDGSLLYAPPPSFPLTSDEYVSISWDES